MRTLCLTAGTKVPDLLWALNVLPALRRERPDTELFWECPIAELQEWLGFYRELNRVVGDVEALDSPPDEYRIIHPLWLAADQAHSTLEAVYKLAGLNSGAGRALPSRPYAPPVELARPEQYHGKYLCFDPQLREDETISENATKVWVMILSYLAVPAVQLGTSDLPLFDGMVDARDSSLKDTAGIIAHSRLFVGGDSANSCLAQALQTPQIWLELPGSNWWWPRTNGPAEALVGLESFEKLDISAFLSLAWRKMDLDSEGGAADES